MVRPVMRITQRKECNEADVVVREGNCPRNGSERQVYSPCLLAGRHTWLSYPQDAPLRCEPCSGNLPGTRCHHAGKTERRATGGDSRRRACVTSPRSVKRGRNF